MGYYEEKQKQNEEMSDYLYWLMFTATVCACTWAAVELVKFLSRI